MRQNEEVTTLRTARLIFVQRASRRTRVSFIHRTPSIDARYCVPVMLRARANAVPGSSDAQDEHASADGIGVDDSLASLTSCWRSADERAALKVDLTSRRLDAGKIDAHASIVCGDRNCPFAHLAVTTNASARMLSRRRELVACPARSELIGCGQLTVHRSLSYGSLK
jgi:hypothetical protein